MGENNINNQFADTYSRLLSEHNYRGLVDLLSKSTFNDSSARNTAAKLIEDFTEQADIEDKLLAGSDARTKEAYNFISSGPSKPLANQSINEYNKSFSGRFMNAWNGMSDGNGNINVKFRNEEQYNFFINSLGNNIEDARKKGINFGSDYSIMFARDVEDKIGIYKALDKSGVFDIVYQGATPSSVQTNSPGGATTMQTYNIFAGLNSDRTTSVNDRQNFIKMKQVVNEANNMYDTLLSNTKPYYNEMIVSGYMGEDDRKLQETFSHGLIDLQTFKELRKGLEEKYNRVLSTSSLTQMDVWAMNDDNEGSSVLEKLDDNIKKNHLNAEINQAMADGRLHFSHATNGLDIGTMIIIDPKVDKDGKIIKGEYNSDKPIKFFVKDLFKSKAENALRDDSLIAAQMKYVKHQTYTHTYRGVDGSTITGWDQNSDSAIYTNKNGVAERLNKADLLDILDNDVITRRMIDYYSLANQMDNQGNGYTKEYYKVYGGNGFNKDVLYDDVKARCLAAMAQKYKGQSEEYINYMANELLSSILRYLGVNMESTLNEN